MPRVDDLMTESRKKFKRSIYRPWNYMDEIEKETKIKEQESKNKKSKQKDKSRSDETPNTLDAIVVSEKSTLKIESETIESKIKSKNKSDIPNVGKSHIAMNLIVRLAGYQKNLFIFIVDKCISQGELTTGIIKSEELLRVIKTTREMLKTSIHRLVLKQLICREKGKPGREGFYVFSISKEIMEAVLIYKKETPIKHDN